MIWFLLKQLYPSRGTVLDTYLDASRLGLSTTTVLVYSTTTSPSGDSCILFTSEGRQARVSYEQNGFRVVCNRNTKRRYFTNKRGSCSLQHEEGDKIRFGSFWQFTACLISTTSHLHLGE